MKKYIIFTFCVILLQACKEKEALLSTYVFSMDTQYVNYYIDICSNGLMNVTMGMETDTVRVLMEEGGEFQQDENMFISHEEYPETVYFYKDTSYITKPYKKEKHSIMLNNDQITKIKVLITQLNRTQPKDPFVDKKDETHQLKQKNIWHWESYGVIMMTGKKTFKFWYDDMSKEEQQLYEYIKIISPMKIEPVIDKHSCLGGHRL